MKKKKVYKWYSKERRESSISFLRFSMLLIMASFLGLIYTVFVQNSFVILGTILMTNLFSAFYIMSYTIRQTDYLEKVVRGIDNGI
jgi:hypothetical protein